MRSAPRWLAAWYNGLPTGCIPTAMTSTAGCAWCGRMSCSAIATKPKMRPPMRGALCRIIPTRSSASTISSKAWVSKADAHHAAEEMAMTRKQRRLILIGGGLGVLAIAVALMLNAFRDSIVFFNSPSDVVEKHVAPGTSTRLGGLVKSGSVMRADNLRVRFEVTDGKSEIPVSYQGVLPDLFREGQGVVAEGALDAGGTFNADTILAKHDETYMPKEVADALKKSGHWKDDYAQRAALPLGGANK